MRFFIVLFLAAAILSGCSSPDENSLPLHAPGLQTPRVTGLAVTLDTGPTPIAVWGTLNEPPESSGPVNPGGGHLPGQLPASYAFSHPFPNPSDGAVAVKFALPRDARVSLWLVKARWAGDPDMDVAPINGATVPAPANGAVRVLFRNEVLPTGYHIAGWDMNDNQGNPLASGFYRIYFEADTFSCWRDVLVFRSWDELPAGLQQILLHR